MLFPWEPNYRPQTWDFPFQSFLWPSPKQGGLEISMHVTYILHWLLGLGLHCFHSQPLVFHTEASRIRSFSSCKQIYLNCPSRAMTNCHMETQRWWIDSFRWSQCTIGLYQSHLSLQGGSGFLLLHMLERQPCSSGGHSRVTVLFKTQMCFWTAQQNQIITQLTHKTLMH